MGDAKEVSNVRGQRWSSYVYKCVNAIMGEAYTTLTTLFIIHNRCMINESQSEWGKNKLDSCINDIITTKKTALPSSEWSHIYNKKYHALTSEW